MDRLPPHSQEAEQGALGCVLLDPTAITQLEQRAQGEPIFYDLRHQNIFWCMSELHRENKSIDIITLTNRLKTRQQLEAVGGIDYLSHLQDSTPSAANLPAYLDILWEKFLARALINQSAEVISEIYLRDGVNEALLERAKRLHAEFEAKSARGSITPQHLKTPADFEAAYFAHFGFGSKEQTPGRELPIAFPCRIRPQEATLVTGDDGAGKSTMLYYFGIHLAQQGEKLCIASLEMPAPVTLWVMASQLIGAKRLPESEEGMQRAARALAWLNTRVTIYDFLGIGDWRDILDTFRYAAGHHGSTVFILDSVMRIGIADDDYAQQGIAGAQFANFADETSSHLFYVIHQNKGGESGKGKVRGSKLWTANAANIFRISINGDKETKAGETRAKLADAKEAGQTEAIEKYEKEVAAFQRQWDSHLGLHKQRYPGTRQNASHYMWFDHGCFQFRDRWDEPAVNWLERWNKTKRQ